MLFLLSACFVPREPAPEQAQACTRCHGDLSRPGDTLARSAPPFDTFGNTDTTYPGVGAHALHVEGGPTHAPVPCAECHRVPTTPRDEGHNDGVTQIVFGPWSTRDGGYTPTWDSATQRCSNSGCHGARSGVWTRARPEGEVCGACHGLPPPAPHPQYTGCPVCHAAVSSDGGFVSPQLHVNGVADFNDAACDACHGRGENGPPPPSLDGGTLRSQLGVGAHQVHLAGGAKTAPVACQTCHLVPAMVVTPRHPNGGAAEVLPFDGGLWSRATQSCTTGCHGGPSPVWTTLDAGLSCTSCHGNPPALPHPQVANCALCHLNATGPNGQDVVDRTLHVNGVVDVTIGTACNTCHGSATNAAPPQDLSGQSATTLRSVGAHQAHVVGRGLARAVRCEECHPVPTAVLQGVHVNGVTDVVFSGVARANLATPVWNGTSCGSSACHDISNYTVAPGGGTATSPVWTQVDGTQATCTSCHGMPPPLPHVQRADCESCHTNATAQRTFMRPELHVNGRVDFVTP